LNYQAFQTAFSKLPVVGVVEVEKAFPGFDRNALTRWQRAGYLEKIRNGYYRFTARPVATEEELFFIANRIYQPSYVSLQSALSWHGFIPEGVFTVTSVTSLKTQSFNTTAGNFSYMSLRNDLFFGYRLEAFRDFRFKLAGPAKVLLDLLYLFPTLNDESHFQGLRLNVSEIDKKLNRSDFENYLAAFGNRSLAGRAKKLLKYLDSHDLA
jgi:predicted transcriptional regulator of viral defense system